MNNCEVMNSQEREVMKMALEALLWANEEINGWMDEARGLDPVDHPVIMSAIAAIKEALSSPNGEAQPEKRSANEHLEPVGWLIEYEACAGGMNRGSSLTKFDYVWHECSFVSENKDAEIDATKWRNRNETPLYTTPPQRDSSATPHTWVGLTDEEIRPMCGQEWVFDTVKQWVEVIEAKLKEKNERLEKNT